MSLVPSLLQAIVSTDGEAMVMHAGEKPYVVSPSGQVELASRALTLDAVGGILSRLLPDEFQQALEEFGAVQYELPPRDDFPREQFTVVAARGGDDVWVEVRRHRVSDDDRVPEELFPPKTVVPATPTPVEDTPVQLPPAPSGVQEAEPEVVAAHEAARPQPRRETDDALELPEVGQLWPGEQPLSTATPVKRDGPVAPPALRTPPPRVPPAPVVVPPAQAAAPPPVPRGGPSPKREASPPKTVPAPIVPPPVATAPEPPRPVASVRPAAPRESPRQAPPPVVQPPVASAPEPPQPVVAVRPEAPGESPRQAPPPAVQPPVTSAPEPPRPVAPVEPPPPSRLPSPAVVLPMSRSPVRSDVVSPAPRADDTLSGLERLLRTAAARGASTLYLASDARPSVRVDGELQVLDNEPVLTANDVISLLLTLMPDRSHEALRTGATTEWISDLEEIGRVRCMSFSDHCGPGGVFRLMPVRAVSAEQLTLSREVQSLAIEPEGLVLVAGPRSSGKRTLISALVDLINRSRRDHVITIEREVNIVHARVNSFVSQREVRGSDDEMLAAARAALREDPDVLVVEQIRTGALMNVALDAAASGHLVIGGLSAHNATEAIDRIIDLYSPEHARQVQLALADNLRGVIAQVLLPKVGGGRVAARELLLNTPAVAGVIAEGKTSQLPMVIEGGRRHGMAPLGDSLVAYVQGGVVDVRDAYRAVTDRTAFLALLKRKGVDTSALERLA